MPYKSKFNPENPRAIRGLAFQKSVLDIVVNKFNSAIDSRVWLLSLDECLERIHLNTLEQTFGDIVVNDARLPYPIFIECVSIGQEDSIFPEHKVKKFSGKNKYYCFGWDKEKRFVLSSTWNAYARKLPVWESYRKFSRTNIRNLRNQFIGIESFCEKLLKA